MNKKVFVGIAMIDENGNATKSVGLVHDLKTGSIETINTEKLSDESIRILFSNYGKYLHKFYGLKQVVDITEPKHNIENK